MLAGTLEGDAAARGDGRADDLEVDGVNLGWVGSVEGGNPSEVEVEETGPDKVARKHLTTVYAPITVTTDARTLPAFAALVKQSLDQPHTRKDGVVQITDDSSKIVSRLDWYNALVTEVGLPGLDASSKEPVKIVLKLAPVRTVVTKGNGSVSGPSPTQAPHQPWTLVTARFDFAGCGLPCTQASHIGPVAVHLGDQGAEIRGFTVTMPASQVVSGWAAEGTTRDGTLTYRTGEGSVLTSLKLGRMKLERVAPSPSGGGQGMVDLELKPAAVSTDPNAQ